MIRKKTFKILLLSLCITISSMGLAIADTKAPSTLEEVAPEDANSVAADTATEEKDDKLTSVLIGLGAMGIGMVIGHRRRNKSA